MTQLSARAPGKVNLCLYLGELRQDGLHELVSVVQSVSLADELELRPASADVPADEVVCAGLQDDNLAARALAAFRERTGWAGPAQRLTIAKRVPIAGGMGGGSADAAAALRLVAAAAGSAAGELAEMAFALGADVPAQMEPGLALVTGAGEGVRRLPPSPPYGIVVVPIDRRLATAEVFAEADRLRLARSSGELARLRDELERVLEHGSRLPHELMRNDLEAATRSLCPAVDGALDALRAAGADPALVSGSGPTVFGVFEAGLAAATAAAVDLRDRYPGAVACEPVDARFGAPVEVSQASR